MVQLMVLTESWDQQNMFSINFNPIQDGLFWGFSRMEGGAKRPPSLKSVTHILQ